ncbi:MAG: phosphotransferase family protein [Sphingobium sp.]
MLPDPSAFIARGASADVFRLGDGLILKLFHDGIDDGIVTREFDIARTVFDTDLPVARPVDMRDAGGRRGIVYAEVEGPDLLNHLKRRPMSMPAMLRAMAALHVRIHALEAPTLRSRKQVLAEDVENAPVGEPLRRAALDRLEQLIDGGRLSHGDFHPGNILVTAGGLFVIDWSKAAAASPAADVVRTEMLMRFGPGPAQSWWQALLRDAAARRYVRLYRRMTGLDLEALAAWRALVALAWMRHRLPARDDAFESYLDNALAQAGLPPRLA